MSTKNRTVALELGTSNSDIYTVPNNYETQVKSIFISNLTGNQVTFSLDWYDSSTTTYYTITEATKLLPNAIIQITESLWLEEVSQFIGRFHSYTEHRNSFGVKSLDTENNNYGIQVVSGWFVRQFENEYNPLHIHTGSRMSCVGYLALPKGIEKEWEEDYKDHHPANGHIQFAHGTPSGYSNTNFMVKPQVGDFYIFPAELFHCVYPFKTKGERRSFSVNFSFVEVPKENNKKNVDK